MIFLKRRLHVKEVSVVVVAEEVVVSVVAVVEEVVDLVVVVDVEVLIDPKLPFRSSRERELPSERQAYNEY